MAALAVTVALSAIVGLGATGPIRVVLALAFVTFVPGWAVFGRSSAVHGISKVALAVAASLTACLTTAVAMAWLGSWHPLPLFYAVAAITTLALVRPSRRARTVTAPFTAPPLIEPAPPTSSKPALPPSPTQPGRLRLRPEDLRLTGVTIRATFPTRPPCSPHELPEFFARIHGRHPFVSFNLDGDSGAVMETAGSCRLVVRPDCVEYREMTADFGQGRDHAVDVFEEVQTRLSVPVLTTPSCRLQAHWVLAADGSDRSSLFDQVAGLHGSEAMLRSTGPVGVMLHLTGDSAELGGTWRLSAEPHGGDALLIDLMIDYSTDSSTNGAGNGSGNGAGNASALGLKLDRAHQFLVERVVPFVASAAGTTTGG